MNLAGKVVLITGASSGIGSATGENEVLLIFVRNSEIIEIFFSSEVCSFWSLLELDW